ncbi:MAG: hypothetical protein DRJ08_02820 [Acidobacteria bacterium]|nr:MAG: hypothetical protein DRJ14_05535 [Acidobacteriota bacterium]RLE23250.1 MAG: hypothetical protein DRJ08_02820 [Acidobacteriota bacterium]
MKLRFLFILATVSLCFAPALSVGLSGTYVSQAGQVTLTLVIRDAGNGSISGTLTSSSTGQPMQLTGQSDGSSCNGTITGSGGSIFFEAMKQGTDMRVILIQPDAKGMPDYNKAQELMFKKSGGTPFGSGGNPLAGGHANPLAGNPLAKRNTGDSLSGTYSGSGLKLTLSGTGGNYTGTLVFNGTRYPVSASGSGNQLKGAFRSGSDQFPFSGALQGNILSFQTGGTSYKLTKAGHRVPANPLQKKGNVFTGAGASAAPDGSRVASREFGFSFQPPADWVARVNPGAGYILGSQNHKGVILVSHHSYPSLEKMRTEAAGGLIDPKSNVRLIPEDGFESVGNNGFGGLLSGTIQGKQAKAYLLGLMSPYGGGVSILVAVTPESYTSQYPGFAKTLAASVQFSRPVPAN